MLNAGCRLLQSHGLVPSRRLAASPSRSALHVPRTQATHDTAAASSGTSLWDVLGQYEERARSSSARMALLVDSSVTPTPLETLSSADYVRDPFELRSAMDLAAYLLPGVSHMSTAAAQQQSTAAAQRLLGWLQERKVQAILLATARLLHTLRDAFERATQQQSIRNPAFYRSQEQAIVEGRLYLARLAAALAETIEEAEQTGTWNPGQARLKMLQQSLQSLRTTAVARFQLPLDGDDDATFAEGYGLWWDDAAQKLAKACKLEASGDQAGLQALLAGQFVLFAMPLVQQQYTVVEAGFVPFLVLDMCGRVERDADGSYFAEAVKIEDNLTIARWEHAQQALETSLKFFEHCHKIAFGPASSYVLRGTVATAVLKATPDAIEHTRRRSDISFHVIVIDSPRHEPYTVTVLARGAVIE